LADSIANTMRVSLTELQTMSESMAKFVTKALAENITSTDVKALIVSRLLSEFVNALDSTIALTISKGFSDIVSMNDWLSIRLQKPTVWTTGAKPLVAYSSLYGRPLYGTQLYSGLFATVWIGIKTKSANNGWTNFNELRNQ